MQTEMDVLVIENHVFFKQEQPAWVSGLDRLRVIELEAFTCRIT